MNQREQPPEAKLAHDEPRCRLCGASRKVHNSHIVPDFFIRSLERKVPVGRKGGLQRTSILLSTRPEIESGQKQRGYWEKEVGLKEMLLCADCENKLSRYETVFREFFYGNDPPPLKKQPQGNVVKVPENFAPEGVRETREIMVPYPEFKLFVLSLLWRAGVATGDFFREVKLGTEHEMRLAKMLLEENPGAAEEYPIVMVDLRLGDKGMEDVIEQPSSDRDEGRRVYKLIIGGFMFLIYVSSREQKPPDFVRGFALADSGRIIVAVAEATPIVKWWADRLAVTGVLKPKESA